MKFIKKFEQKVDSEKTGSENLDVIKKSLTGQDMAISPKILQDSGNVSWPAPDPSEKLIMGEEENGLGPGWHPLEKAPDFFYRWSGRSATLFLKKPPLKSPWILIIEAFSLPREAGPQLEIFVDEVSVGKQVMKNGWETYRFEFTLKKVARGPLVKIELQVDSVIPAELIVPDPRELGIMIKNLRLKNIFKEVSEIIIPRQPYSENELAGIKKKNLALNNLEISLKKARLESFPTFIEVSHTNKCNLQCLMCMRNKTDIRLDNIDMDDELLKLIVVQLFPYINRVQLSVSGEPTMGSQFFDLLKYSGQYLVDVEMTSNGTLLNNEKIIQAVCEHVKYLCLSIDGACPATYEKIRKFSFKKLLANINQLNELGFNKFKKRPYIQASYTLMRSNIEELPDFIELAKKLRFDCVGTVHMAVHDARFVDECLFFHQELANKYLRLARDRAQELGIGFFGPPPFPVEELIPGAEPVAPPPEKTGTPVPPESVPAIFCTDPWTRCFFELNGVVLPCCAGSHQLLMGEMSRPVLFEDIWNGPAYINLRQSLADGNLIEICQNCHVKNTSANREAIFVKVPKTAEVLPAPPVVISRDSDSAADEIRRKKEANFLLNQSELKQKKIVLESYPFYLVLMNTLKCNLKCIMCARQPQILGDQDIKDDLLAWTVKEIFPYLKSLQLSTSSEPLMGGNFEELLNQASRHFINVELTSNGTLFNNEKTIGLICENVNHLVLSMDAATPATAGKIRVGLNFQKWQENIRLFNELSLNKFHKRPYTVFTFVLMRSNIEEVPEYIKMAKDLKADLVFLQHLVVYDKKLNEEALFFDKERSNLYLTRAREVADRLGVNLQTPLLYDIPNARQVHPEPEAASPPAPEGELAEPQNQFFCSDPWGKSYIGVNGLVAPCCSSFLEAGHYRAGQNFLEIWNSPVYQKMRQGLTSGPLLEDCRHCFLKTANVNDRSSFERIRG